MQEREERERRESVRSESERRRGEEIRGAERRERRMHGGGRLVSYSELSDCHHSPSATLRTSQRPTPLPLPSP